jgi:transcriptional regulator with XRE-family HTH domain
MEIGTKIKKLRENRKMTQPELANILGISQPSLCNIESGDTKKIDFILLDKICKEFEVDFNYFLDESKKLFKVNKSIGGVVGDNATINNYSEGIVENIIKRLEIIEDQIKNLK